VRTSESRKAVGIALVGVFVLLASIAAGAVWHHEATPLILAGFVTYVVCAGRAMRLWHVDEIVLGRRESRERRQRRAPPAAAAALLLALICDSGLAQQTIFNIPSADVLDRGKLYLEEDTLWRTQEPDFALFTMRGVYGFGCHVEGGFNFGGFVTPGRSTPVAVASVKWQPLKVGAFALTTGAQGLFFLRGSEDGDPSGHFYVHGSFALPTNTRVTAGGWIATPGFAGAKTTGGALVGFEQKLADHLNLIADWYSGKNGIGYFTPGFSSTWSGWTVYAGYSFKNDDSKGNAMLLELGLAF